MSGLRVGEAALFTGRRLCGEIKRLGERRFQARDRLWRIVGVYTTEAAVRRAICRSNDRLNAAPLMIGGAPITSVKPMRSGRRPYASLKVKIGMSVTIDGPTHAGRIKHLARRHYTALPPSGAPVVATSLRRALEALRADAEPVGSAP